MSLDFSATRVDTVRYELFKVISNLEEVIIQLTSDVKALNTRMNNCEKTRSECHESMDDIDKIISGN